MTNCIHVNNLHTKIFILTLILLRTIAYQLRYFKSAFKITNILSTDVYLNILPDSFFDLTYITYHSQKTIYIHSVS